jgi:hypothetical protein
VTHNLKRTFLTGLLLFGMSISLVGCSTNTEMSKQEQENFKGGPMPPGFLEKQGGGAPAPGPAASPSGGTASPQVPPPAGGAAVPK